MVPYGTTMVPQWYHYGTIMVPQWYHNGTILVPYGTIWYHYGTIMVQYGPLWYHNRTIWYLYGTIMVPFLYHFGTIWYHLVPYGPKLSIFPFFNFPFSKFSKISIFLKFFQCFLFMFFPSDFHCPKC